MNGYGSHTFSFLNAEGERNWVKFHFKTAQGIRNFSNEDASSMKGQDADWAQRDLVQAIDQGDFPRWNVKVQVMSDAAAKSFRWNPFDLTKVWPHGEFPLIDVGVLELNRVPDNYFADVEQSAFAPAHVVDGIGYSPDKMLQGRILSYPDAHRYRLGANYEQIPVNRCPFAVHNYQRDGHMRVDGNGGSGPNYYPNSFDDIVADPQYKEPAQHLDSLVADWFDRNAAGEDDHYTQPGILFEKVMTEVERDETVRNIVGALGAVDGPMKTKIQMRQLCHFFRASAQLGMRVAEGIGVSMADLQPYIQHS
jgi:catalase